MKDDSQQLIQDRITELRENTDFVATLFESLVGYAIIAADFDGNIIAFNEGAHQIYGYVPEEVIGKQNIEVFFPEDFIEAGKLQQIIDDLIGKGRFAYEGEKVRKNGDRFPAQILLTLTRNKNGGVVGFIEITQDRTGRKRAERAEAEVRANEAWIQQLEQEIHSLEGLSGAPQATIAAGRFGVLSLHEAMPDMFNELVRRYGDTMDLAVEQRIYRVDHHTSEQLRSLGEKLGFSKAGPRDVVEVHTTALKKKTNGTTPQGAVAFTEEGRLMVLELMGYLASHYRNYSTGFHRINEEKRHHG